MVRVVTGQRFERHADAVADVRQPHAPAAGGDTATYVAMTAILAILVGVMLVAAGVMKLGFLADFLAKPVRATDLVARVNAVIRRLDRLRSLFRAHGKLTRSEIIAILGVDYLIPIGGDDTLSYGVRLYKEGVKVVAIPKTMDNDVPGTDYCIGFSTCATRTINMNNTLRTSTGCHDRSLEVEVSGR